MKIWLPDSDERIDAYVTDKGQVTVNTQTVPMKLKSLEPKGFSQDDSRDRGGQ